jgi:DNA helicase IV
MTLERVRFLAETYRNVIDQVPIEYQRFRRESLKNGRWFRAEARTTIERGRVNGLEVDVLLLIMLRHARTFLQRRGGPHTPGLDTRIATLDSVKGEYVTQVLVDEATDFSAVQLACMKELARPEFFSFFICGDVNQRITSWGVRTLEELRWIADDFEIREVSIGYRQSRRLAELAVALTKLQGATAAELTPPPHLDDADIAPLLAENLRDGALGKWLAERVREVERSLRAVPSIAIFVDGDERIDPLVNAMRPHLEEYNLDVVGCKEGKVVGTERQIRVFDVRHIKGLEFEAVFFVGVDMLASGVPDLFDKFLFVGTTRAATYLGLTCETVLPAGLEAVRSHFTTATW